MTTDAQNLRLAALAINGDLAYALRKFLDECNDRLTETEGVWPAPDMGCRKCSFGQVTPGRNTGPCLFHMATEVLGEHSSRKPATDPVSRP